MLRVFKRYKKHMKIYNELELLREQTGDTSKITISESFKQFMNKTIPEIEKKVEVRLLSSIYHKIKNESVKNELLHAYKRRQLDLHFDLVRPETVFEGKRVVPEEVDADYDIFAPDIRNVTAEDVHKFFEFPLLEFEHMFPSINFGHLYYVEKVLKRTHKFATQLTPDAFKIVRMLQQQIDAKETLFSQLGVFDELDLCDSAEDLDQLYTNHKIYMKLTYWIGDGLRQAVSARRFDEKAGFIFTQSFMYDTLVNVLVWQMHRKEVRELLLKRENLDKVCESIVQQVIDHPDSKFFQTHNAKAWAELQKFLRLSDSVVIDLEAISTQLNRNPSRTSKHLLGDFTSFNSNMLIYGDEGCGKSGLLTTVCMWARANDWIVLKVPSVFAITQNTKEEVVRHEKSRLYINPILSEKTLEDFVISNKAKLGSVPVNLDIYGNYNVVGVHKDEANPVPNFHIKDRQVDFYESDKFITPQDMEALLRANAKYDRNLKEELPEPKTLLELAEFGLKEPDLAINVLAEIKEQLYNTTEVKVLVAVDDYNWFFRPSSIPSFRYASMKTLNGYIPPYHIALCRLFMDFDGHKIANGFKIAASSNYSIRKHHFVPHKINFPEHACFKLKGMDVTSLTNFKHFAYLHNMDYCVKHEEDTFKRLWMETQGNYKQLIYCLEYPDMAEYKLG